MADIYYEEFQKYWKKFVTQLQGQIMTQAKKGMLIHSSMNLILADCVGFWDSTHSEGGRWLNRYEAEYPEKAGIIRDILLKDMKFAGEEENSSKYEVLKYIIPMGGAVAGFAISGGIGVSNLVRAACTVVPAAVAYPVTVNIMKMKAEDGKKELIQAYMNQLGKYKRSIEIILQDIESVSGRNDERND